MKFIINTLSLGILFCGTVFSMNHNYRQAGIADGRRLLAENRQQNALNEFFLTNPVLLELNDILFHEDPSSSLYSATFDNYKSYWSGIGETFSQYEASGNNNQQNHDLSNLINAISTAPDMETVRRRSLETIALTLQAHQTQETSSSLNPQRIFILDTNSPEYQEGYTMQMFNQGKMIEEIQGAAPVAEERTAIARRYEEYYTSLRERCTNSHSFQNAQWHFIKGRLQALFELDLEEIITGSPHLTTESKSQLRMAIAFFKQIFQSQINQLEGTPNALLCLQNAAQQLANDIDLPMRESEPEE